MEKASGVAAGRAVPQRQLVFPDAEPGAHGVDRHPKLTTEPWCEREAGLASGRGERALPGERLASTEAAAGKDESPRGALREPEASAVPFRKDRDRQIGIGVQQRR